MVNDYGDKVHVLRYSAHEQTEDGSYQPIVVRRWAELLLEEEDYISDFLSILKEAPMKAYFFETKGVTQATVSEKPFEFVLVESSYLYGFADAEQDSDTFAEHLTCGDNPMGCVFDNLGGDTLLISPKQVQTTPNNIYGHLAAFVRRAPAKQVVSVWKLVLETYLSRVESESPRKVWFSTDGSGVAWLHVRLDPRPKYYDYAPFANEP